MDQFLLDFDQQAEFSSENFFVTESNALIYSAVLDTTNWDAPIMILQGAKGSGKTHLCHIWSEEQQALFLERGFSLRPELLEEYDAFIVDDIAECSQEKLFHLYNHVVNEKKKLLMTTEQPIGLMKFELADLSSRLKSVPQLSFDLPDDALIHMLLVKQLSDRQLRISKPVLNYIIPRLPRSYLAIHELVNQLDQTSLMQGRNITIPFARDVLESLG